MLHLVGPVAANVSAQYMSHKDALRTFVVREVLRVLNGPTSDWKYDLVRRFDLLPISADASGALFLRADGEA